MADALKSCDCQGCDTCPCCCWAFPVEHGIWAQDWDVNLVSAIRAARKAAATPFAHDMLEICSCDTEVRWTMSSTPKTTMARLLDIAILTGNQKAAINLSKKCQLRPLRRWALDWRHEDGWKAMWTALWTGAEFQDLIVKDFHGFEDVPFPEALFLRSLENWQKICHLLPKRHDLWRPRNLDNHFGEFFLQRRHGRADGWKLSLDKIRGAEDAGLDLQFFFLTASGAFLTLLDIAIWFGQPDCAKACVDAGIELKGDDKTLDLHKEVWRGQSWSLQVPSEAQIAAAAAGRAWLKRLWKTESSQKGIVLYQMVKMFKGRSFPMVLVQEILTFSMPVPKIIDQLDLWEHVRDWMTTIGS